MRPGTAVRVLIRVCAFSLMLLGYAQAQQIGQQRDVKPSVDALQTQKLRDNFYVIMGGGGTSSVFITTKGVVVVDMKNPGWGHVLLEKIKTITDKPLIMVINTHSHQDHTGGNVELPPGVEIVAQENSKKNMATMDLFKKPGNEKFLPTKTFKDKMSLFSGQDRIDLYYFGVGGTDGDAWVVFPALRLMATGDGCSGKHLSIISNNTSGGRFVPFPETLSRVVANIKNVDTIIPGHEANVLPFSDLKLYADFYKDFLDWTVAERKAGKTVDQAVAEYKVPEKYASHGFTPGVDRAVRSDIQGIYSELTN
jgi:cyclase